MFLLFRGNPRLDTHDTPGRIVEMLVVMVGMLLLAFMCSLVITAMTVKSEDSFALVWLEAHKRADQQKVYAAELIQAYCPPHAPHAYEYVRVAYGTCA